MQPSCLRCAGRIAARRSRFRILGRILHPWPAMSFLNVQMFSTTEKNSPFAAVDHSRAYELSMEGRHGQQLALAKLEGEGKDDPPFDPFLEEELEEERRLRGEQKQEKEEEEADDDDEEEEVAELVRKKEDEDEEIEDYDDDEIEEEEDDLEDFSSVYNNDGTLRRLKSEFATLRAGAPAGGMFAVIELAGTQHKVTTDDLLIVNRLRPVDTFKVGSIHTLKDVLLVSSSHLTLVGMPYVSGAEVDVMVEEITKDAKVIVFKKRRRKNSKRKTGFRRDITMLRVLDIRPPEGHRDHKHIERPEPAKLHDSE